MKQIYDFEQKAPPVLNEKMLRAKKKKVMKKRVSVIMVSVLAVGIITYFPAKQILGKNDILSEWGKILSGETTKEIINDEKYNDTKYRLSTKGIISNNIVSGDEVIEAGSDILITRQEMERVKSFYVLKGQSEKEAEKTALKYIEEYNAMYVEAVNNGFNVTEKEVDEYILALKTTMKQAANASDVEKIIAQFESEEEYWEFEKMVYQKQLPVQKYVATLEDVELEKIQEAAVKKQKFKKVNSEKDIDEKFEVRS